MIDMGELLLEETLRAMIYSMEAEMGIDAAKSMERYQKLDEELAELEAKHVAELRRVLNL